MKLLDLFCGAGGAAVGYHRAGFEVIGVDCHPQPGYPFAFIQADALDVLGGDLSGYDAIHASPPCQAYTKGAKQQGTARHHPDLLEEVRRRLHRWQGPFVIENVLNAPMWDSVTLCGAMFGLGVFRLRLFELGWHHHIELTHPRHNGKVGDGRYFTVAGSTGGTSIRDGIAHGAVAEWKVAMGIDWMSRRELAQAIPPAYTQFIGTHLRAEVEHRRLHPLLFPTASALTNRPERADEPHMPNAPHSLKGSSRRMAARLLDEDESDPLEAEDVDPDEDKDEDEDEDEVEDAS